MAVKSISIAQQFENREKMNKKLCPRRVGGGLGISGDVSWKLELCWRVLTHEKLCLLPAGRRAAVTVGVLALPCSAPQFLGEKGEEKL